MKKQFVLLFCILSLCGCSEDQTQAALGNPKHTCTYDNYIFADIKNISNHSVHILFCSKDLKDKKLSGEAAPDQAEHRFIVKFDTQTVTFYDSAAESCRDKGYSDRFSNGTYASLTEDDLAISDLCLNHFGYKQYPPDYKVETELYIAVNKGAACPNGFEYFDQTQNPCQP